LLHVLTSAVFLRSNFSRTFDHISLPEILDLSLLEGQVLVFIFTMFIFAGFGPLFIASCGSEGYGSAI
jgi:hypothetical protein